MENSTNNTMPNNNMGLAIAAAIIGCCSPCCIGLILGIVAIVMATQVKKKFESNDFEGAASSAKNAKILAFVAIGIAVIYLLYIGMNWEDTMEKFNEAMEQYQLNQ
ncbi:MAG: CD225/dispanin family protein [Flavobacteriaceae bacterium]